MEKAIKITTNGKVFYLSQYDILRSMFSKNQTR